MIRFLAVLVLLVPSLPCLAQAGSSWNGLADVDADHWPVAATGRISAVSDATASPVIAWSDSGSGTPQIRVSRWSGTDWVDHASASLSTPEASSDPCLFFDPTQGTLSLAWLETESFGIRRIHVSTWNADVQSWVSLGSPAGIQATRTASSPVLARYQMRLVVAWTEHLAGIPQIYAKFCLDADAVAPAWEEEAGSASGDGVSASTTGAGQPAVAFNHAKSAACIAWVDQDDWHGGIRIRNWTSYAGWSDVTTLTSGTDGIIDSESAPHLKEWGDRMWLTWSLRTSSGRQIYALHCEGASWTWDDPGASAHGQGISYSNGSPASPQVAYLSTGVPMITWLERSGTAPARVYLRTLNATADFWEGIDGSASEGGLSGTEAPLSTPRVVAGPTDTPVVCWLDGNGTATPARMVVRQKDPSWGEWSRSGSMGYGVSAGATFGATAPAMVMDSQGLPIIAWSQRETNGGAEEIHLRRWNGSAWVGIGGSDATGGLSRSPSMPSQAPALAIDAQDHIVVAWEEGASYREICVRRWNGTAWVELAASATVSPTTQLGGITHSAVWSRHPSVALDAAGDPVVAWTEWPLYNAVYKRPSVYAKRWNSTTGTWTGLAGSDSAEGISGADPTPADQATPCIACAPDGQIFVAWTYGWASGVPKEIRAKMFRPQFNAWQAMSTGERVSPPTGDHIRPVCVIDAAGNPMVAWEGSGGVQMLRWDAGEGTWKTFGGEALSPMVMMGGTRPALVLGSDGHPLLAMGGACVRVLRWDGGTWVGYGPSHVVPGVSYAAKPVAYGMSTATSIVGVGLNSFGDPCAVWTDDAQVYFRHYSAAVPRLERLAQWQADGAAEIPNGGMVVVVDDSGSASILVQAVLNSPDGDAKVEVQRIEEGADESTAVSTASGFIHGGTPAMVPIDLPLDGAYRKGYRWRIRATDRRGTSGDWVEFGVTTDADVVVRDDEAPVAGTPGQYIESTGLVIAMGATVEDRTMVTFRAAAADPDGDRVRLQVRLLPFGPGGGAEQNLVGDLCGPGIEAPVSGRLLKGSYRWECRLVDEYGKAGAWTPHSVSAPVPDLVVGAAGSFGSMSTCGLSATGLGGAAMMFGLLMLGVLRR